MHTDGWQPGILLFMLAALAAVGGSALILLAVLVRKYDVARRLTQLALVAAGGYWILLLGAGLTSRDRVLALGEEKHFCEIDCHMAYAVLGDSVARTFDPSGQSRPADGMYHAVSVQVRFDEETISSRRPREAPLWPNGRWVTIVDDQGRRFRPSLDGQLSWERAHGPALGLARPLRPGESYATVVVFDLPVDVRNPRLMLENEGPELLFVIGHENSFFHGKTRFQLAG